MTLSLSSLFEAHFLFRTFYSICCFISFPISFVNHSLFIASEVFFVHHSKEISVGQFDQVWQMNFLFELYWLKIDFTFKVDKPAGCYLLSKSVFYYYSVRYNIPFKIASSYLMSYSVSQLWLKIVELGLNGHTFMFAKNKYKFLKRICLHTQKTDSPLACY